MQLLTRRESGLYASGLQEKQRIREKYLPIMSG